MCNNTFRQVVYSMCVCLHHKICLHNEEANPGVLSLLSPKPERLGSLFVSSSLLDDSGFEEEDDDDESKRHDLHDESNVSFCFSPVPVQKKRNCFEVCWVIFQNSLILTGIIRI